MNLIKKIFLLSLLCLPACSGTTTLPNILLLPQYLSIDSTNNRLFVVDSQNNGLSLINPSNNTVVGDAPLLNSSSSIQLPAFPQDIAVTNLGNGVTRIFVVGTGSTPSNQVMVLDYDSTNGLQISSISPLTAGSNTTAILSGLAIDPTAGNLFVSDTTDGLVYVYNTTTGTPNSSSPITVNTRPVKLSLNASINSVFVSSLGGTSISVINTQTLTATSVVLGTVSSSVSSVTNSVGNVLFAVNPADNEVYVFNYNATSNTVTAISGSPITPPIAGQTVPSNNVLTGAATQVAATLLSTGVIAGFITESTGDLGFVDVAADLSSFSQQGVITIINAQGANGIAILNDSSGNGSLAYFAAASGSTVTYVNVVTNQFVDQIF